MNRIFQHSNQVQMFEWTILLVALGIIAIAVHPSIEDQQAAKAVSNLLPENGLTVEEQSNRETMSRLAEQAWLAELSLAYAGSEPAKSWLSDTDWLSLGISPDEQTFFSAWRSTLTDTSLTAGEWLEQLQEAHRLYLSIGDILTKNMREDTLFGEVEKMYNIPAGTIRLRSKTFQPATTSQWALFVSQYRQVEK